MEAENFLSDGYAFRRALAELPKQIDTMSHVALVWQPSRLKGIQVSRAFGTPFLASTQVFDLRPSPRKFLSLDRTDNSALRFVEAGTIVVTCSGTVGRTTLAYDAHAKMLISHDLLRVKPIEDRHRGWLYSYLRSEQAKAMMQSAQYGHIIKHLEPEHLDALPTPVVRDDLLEKFNSGIAEVLERRNRAWKLQLDAEGLFAKAVGQVADSTSAELGFSVRASELLTGRRRLEAGYHSPSATTIIKRFGEVGRAVETLSDVTTGVWWMTRFKRVFGTEGVPYLSADELFSINPPITKRVMIEQADNPDDYRVKAGWIVMACSGQTYGLNGSVSLMTKRHESAFFSHDLVRIVPDRDKVRPGYLFTALGHPTLGRPIVIRNAYGTSIPHLEPADVELTPIVRFDATIEDAIADRMEEAIELRVEADALENELAGNATKLIEQLLSGDFSAFA